MASGYPVPGFSRRKFLIGAAAALASTKAATFSRGMRMHLSCGALGIKATQREAIDYAAKYGFDAVDADGNYLAGLPDAEVSSLLDYMKSKNVGWAMAGLPVDFRHDDPMFFDALRVFPSYVRRLQRAGVTRVTTWLSPASKQIAYVANFRLHAQRLRDVAAALHDGGIRFGIEYVAPKTAWASQKFPFIHTMAELKELIAEINKPNVGLVLDSWHWYNAGDTNDDLLSLRATDVVSVDLNDAPAGIPVDQQVDNKRELPGATGVIDVAGFLGSLEKIGYTGPVRAEPFNEAIRRMTPDEALSTTMASLKKAFAA
jgi:sugar phosphate isomerase/epimerase